MANKYSLKLDTFIDKAKLKKQVIDATNFCKKACKIDMEINVKSSQLKNLKEAMKSIQTVAEEINKQNIASIKAQANIESAEAKIASARAKNAKALNDIKTQQNRQELIDIKRIGELREQYQKQEVNDIKQSNALKLQQQKLDVQSATNNARKETSLRLEQQKQELNNIKQINALKTQEQKQEVQNLKHTNQVERERLASQRLAEQAKLREQKLLQQQEQAEKKLLSQTKQREVYEKQLLAIRQQYSKAFSVTSGLKNDNILKQYNDMMSTIRNGGDISNMSKDMSILRNEIKGAGLDSKSFGDMMVSNFSKFAQWLSIGTVIIQTINQVKQAYQFTVEMDSALTNINFTMDMTASQLRGISEASLQMADDLNTSAKNIMQGVTLYANANETAESILNKTKPATMLSNVTGMQVEQTAHILQSVMNQMDMTQEDLMHISDVLQGTSVLMAHDFSE